MSNHSIPILRVVFEQSTNRPIQTKTNPPWHKKNMNLDRQNVTRGNGPDKRGTRNRDIRIWGDCRELRISERSQSKTSHLMNNYILWHTPSDRPWDQ